MRNTTLIAIVFTAVCIVGCSSSQPVCYTETVNGESAEVKVHNVNAGVMEDIKIEFDLTGKADGDILRHSSVYADPATEDASNEVEYGALAVEYVVGKGVTSLTWKGDDVPANTD